MIPRRFTIRTLLAGVTAMCICLAWFTAHARQYYIEHASIERLRALYGVVVYQDDFWFCAHWSGGDIHVDWRGPTCLREPLKVCGFPIMYRVEEVSLTALHHETIDADTITDLAAFSHLRKLSLPESALTPQAAERLAELRAERPEIECRLWKFDELLHAVLVPAATAPETKDRELPE